MFNQERIGCLFTRSHLFWLLQSCLSPLVTWATDRVRVMSGYPDACGCYHFVYSAWGGDCRSGGRVSLATPSRPRNTVEFQSKEFDHAWVKKTGEQPVRRRRRSVTKGETQTLLILSVVGDRQKRVFRPYVGSNNVQPLSYLRRGTYILALRPMVYCSGGVA